MYYIIALLLCIPALILSFYFFFVIPILTDQKEELTEDEKKVYLTALYSRIRKFNFVTAWDTRKMYDLKDSRMKEIMGWLNNEKEEDKTAL